MGAVFSDEPRSSDGHEVIVIKSVPEKPKKMPVVISWETFERLKSRSQALSEIDRLSKNGSWASNESQPEKPKKLPVVMSWEEYERLKSRSQALSEMERLFKNGSRASNESQPIKDKYDLSKRANVLVFHHYEYEDKRNNRDGSMRDMEKIEEVLKHYRTDPLQIHSNCSLPALRRVMDNVSKTDFSKNSCLIVFIMSHGGIQDTILAHDGGWYSLQEDIVEKCTLNNTLNGKPKIFVIQACRGNAHMQTDSTKKVMSDKSDIVIFQSTYEGSVSWRTMGGTFFMQEFLNLLQSIESSIDVNELNMSLNARFRKESINQTPTLTTTLQKRLFFHDLRS